MHYNLPNFIIGGAPKSGTSSLFSYLSGHPEVCASTIKETAFFITGYSGNIAIDKERYSKYFNSCLSQKVIMEGSVGYLGYGQIVAERMASMLNEPKVLFVLRHPVERFISYYNYLRSIYALSAEITLREYYEACHCYQNNRNCENNMQIDKYHLLALEHGKYIDYLPYYFRFLCSRNIFIMFYDDLKYHEKAFVCKVCSFIGIDPTYYDNYQFKKANETLLAKSDRIHKVAVQVNRLFEPTLRRHRKLKIIISDLYRRINIVSSREGLHNPANYDFLKEYYAQSIADLRKYIDNKDLWP